MRKQITITISESEHKKKNKIEKCRQTLSKNEKSTRHNYI
jgi:hypothetical protein